MPACLPCSLMPPAPPAAPAAWLQRGHSPGVGDPCPNVYCNFVKRVYMRSIWPPQRPLHMSLMKPHAPSRVRLQFCWRRKWFVSDLNRFNDPGQHNSGLNCTPFPWTVRQDKHIFLFTEFTNSFMYVVNALTKSNFFHSSSIQSSRKAGRMVSQFKWKGVDTFGKKLDTGLRSILFCRSKQ